MVANRRMSKSSKVKPKFAFYISDECKNRVSITWIWYPVPAANYYFWVTPLRPWVRGILVKDKQCR